MATVFEAATRAGDRICELPGTNRRYNFYLDDPGSAEITVPLDRFQRYEVDPGACELHVRRDGELVWTGPIWGARASTRDNSLYLTAAGLPSYFEGQRIRSTLSYTATDQATIWRALLQIDAANWNLTVPVPATTGVARSYRGEDAYHAYKRLDIAQTVDQLASLPDGFDWDITPDRIARLYYPRQGVFSDHVLELGRNLDHVEVEVNARTIETVVDALGSGEGTAMPIRTVEAPLEILRYGRRHGVLSAKDVTNRSILAQRASTRLAIRARASEVPRLVMLPGKEPTFGQVGLGDTVEVRASYGWLSLMGAYRLVGIEVTVENSGAESIAYLPADPVDVAASEVT